MSVASRQKQPLKRDGKQKPLAACARKSAPATQTRAFINPQRQLSKISPALEPPLARSVSRGVATGPGPGSPAAGTAAAGAPTPSSRNTSPSGKFDATHSDLSASKLSDPARSLAIRGKQWAAFAQSYNGRDYAKFNYDGHLAAAYADHSRPAPGLA